MISIKSIMINGEEDLKKYGHLAIRQSDGSLLSIREQYRDRTKDNMTGFYTEEHGTILTKAGKNE